MRLKRSVFAVLLIVLIIAGAVYLFLPQFHSTQSFVRSENIIADIPTDARITRDRRGMPCIRADGNAELFFALGFLHAQDRLPVMEYYRAIALGSADRVIAGDDGRILSGLAVLLNIPVRADEILSGLKEPYHSYLSNYIKGINEARSKHYFSRGMKSIPEDRPWKESDCIAIFIINEWFSSFQNNSELVFPVSEKRYTPSIEDFVPRGIICTYPERDSSKLELLRSLKRIVRERISVPGEGFAVSISSGRKAEAHAAVRYDGESLIFPFYYPVSVMRGDKTSYCVSTTGMPFFLSSISSSFSYSVFNASLDAMDFYLLPVEKRNEGIFYKSQLEWKKFTSTSKVFKSGELIFRVTEFGPVLSDLFPSEADQFCIVVKYPMADVRSIISRFDLSVSATVPAALAAVAEDAGYPKSVFLSDGITSFKNMSGLLPIRPIRNRLFHDGNYATVVMNLSSLRSYPRGGVFVCSGNFGENEFGELNEYKVYHYAEHEQACASIALQDITQANLSDTLLQNEFRVFTKISTPLMTLLGNLKVTSAKLSKIYLADWKGDLSGQDIAPTIAYQLIFSFISETLSDDLGPDIRSIYENPSIVYGRLANILDKGDSRAIDNISTSDKVETLYSIFELSFLKGMRTLHRSYGPEMGKWKWERVARSRYEIPFIKDDVFFNSSQSPINTENVRYDGTVTYHPEKGISFIPRAAISVIMWDNILWSSNFTLTTNPRSPNYSNAITSSRLNPFDVNDSASEILIHPVQGANSPIKDKGKVSK
jgi:acyl-homoserine lactone acylase PvdQ